MCEAREPSCVIIAEAQRESAGYVLVFEHSLHPSRGYSLSCLPLSTGRAWGQGQSWTGTPAGRTLWRHAVKKSGMIFLTSRRLCHPRVSLHPPIIGPDSLPVRDLPVWINYQHVCVFCHLIMNRKGCIQIQKCVKGIAQVFLKWGCISYLLIVSVLASVDGGQVASDIEKLGPVLTGS